MAQPGFGPRTQLYTPPMGAGGGIASRILQQPAASPSVKSRDMTASSAAANSQQLTPRSSGTTNNGSPLKAQASIREQLINFYAKHNPAKVPDVDTILESFYGQEDLLFQSLKEKYGDDGSLTLPPLQTSSSAASMTSAAPAAAPAPSSTAPYPPPSQSGFQSQRPQSSSSASAAPVNNASLASVGGNPSFNGHPPAGTSSHHQRLSFTNQSSVSNGSLSGEGQSPRQSSGDPTSNQHQLHQQQRRRRTTSLFEDMNPQMTESFQELDQSLREILRFDPLIRVHDDDKPPQQLMDGDGGGEDFESVPLSEFVTVVTRFQHVCESFVLQAKRIVEYSRQRAELDALHRSHQQKKGGGEAGDAATAGTESETGDAASYLPQIRPMNPTRFTVSARSTHYQRMDAEDRPPDGSGGLSRTMSSSPFGGGGGSPRGLGFGGSGQNPQGTFMAPGTSGLFPAPQDLTTTAATDTSTYSGYNVTGRSERMVIDVVPMGEERNVISDIVRFKAKPGDVIVLHPGTYRENIVCTEGMNLEFRPATNRDDTSVIILPADPKVPLLQLEANATVKVSSLIFQEPARTAKEIEEWSRAQRKKQLKLQQSHPNSNLSGKGGFNLSGTGGGGGGAAPPLANSMDVPLVSASQSARCDMRNCAFIGGTGGVLAFGNAQVHLIQCTIRKSAFAGAYCKDSAFLSATNCHFISCEVAIRVRDSTFSMQHCDVRNSLTDGVALHGSCKGIIDRTTISASNDNGVILSPSCVVMFSNTLIERSAMWAIYAPTGADFALNGVQFADNGMGDTSLLPPTQSAAPRLTGAET
jgi:hypothetical protein